VKRLFYIIPVTVFAGLAFLLYIGLFQGPPSELPSPLVGKPAPDFTLPALDSQAQQFSRAELGNGHSVIVNFWASWCTPCRLEHQALQQLATRKGITLYGIDYKDKPENARAFLSELGNPFGRIDQDQEGRVSIDWGVTGVPETFVIDSKGTIQVHYAGPLDDEVINRLIVPALAKDSATSAAKGNRPVTASQ
jgi:cytochrome c biogenesis protein CcmG, thiol:disulfide interchange protein DsbE